MADQAGPASVMRPVQALPPRQLAVPWIAVAALAAVAWAVTVLLARTMGNGPGTMGLALLPFLGLWVVMMAAMMLPSVAPVAVLWTRLITGASAGPGRLLRMSGFLAGYLLAECAGTALGFGEGGQDAARYRQIAELCIAAGAEQALIGRWFDIGRERAASAQAMPHAGPPAPGFNDSSGD